MQSTVKSLASSVLWIVFATDCDELCASHNHCCSVLSALVTWSSSHAVYRKACSLKTDVSKSTWHSSCQSCHSRPVFLACQKIAHPSACQSCLSNSNAVNFKTCSLVSTKIFYVKINLYKLFGVGALAHRGLPPGGGFVRDVPLAFPAPHPSAREGCPGHCDTLAPTAVLVYS